MPGGYGHTHPVRNRISWLGLARRYVGHKIPKQPARHAVFLLEYLSKLGHFSGDRGSRALLARPEVCGISTISLFITIDP